MTDDTCPIEDVFAKAVEWVEFEADYAMFSGVDEAGNVLSEAEQDARDGARREALFQVTALLTAAAQLLKMKGLEHWPATTWPPLPGVTP